MAKRQTKDDSKASSKLTSKREVAKKSVKKTSSRKFKLPVPKYFSGAWSELRKVNWPTRKESLRLTLAVFIFSAFFAVVIALADIVFKNLAERIFL